MTLSLAEGLVDAVIAYLDANQTAKLDALDAEYADGIELADTVQTIKGIGSLDFIEAFPALYVIAPTQQVAPLAASGGASVTSRPELLLGVLVLEEDYETLQIRLYRYARALVEMVLEAMDAGDQLASWNLATDEVWEIDTERSRLSTDADESRFIGEVVLAIPRANKIETL